MKTYNITIKTGQFVDKGSGENRAVWTQIGTLIDKEDGNEPFIKLDALMLSSQLNQIGNEYNERYVIFSCFDNEKKRYKKPAAYVHPHTHNPDGDDDIPF